MIKWMGKLATFDNKKVHRNGVSIVQDDLMSKNHSQDTAGDPAQELTLVGEQSHQQKIDTEFRVADWPDHSFADDKTTSVTHQSLLLTLTTRQHLYTQNLEQTRDRQLLEIVQTVCQ